MKKLTLILIILALTIGSITKTTAQINYFDSLALVDLYNSTNGNGWYSKTNWLTSQPVRTWSGVRVTSNRVTELLLTGLKGTIPNSIGNLTSLTSLGLYGDTVFYSGLTGSFPSGILNLTNLKYLALGGGLTGAIPAGISNLTKLTTLSLNRNQFTGFIPVTIGNLTNLNYLYLRFNQFEDSLPSSMENLINLNGLTLTHNKFTFKNLESLLKKLQIASTGVDFTPQAKIPVRHLNGKLSVSVGGSLGNNSYRWYGPGIDTTIVGDSTFTPPLHGKYNVEVSNAIVKQLVLKGDTTSISLLNPYPAMITANGTLQTDISKIDDTKLVKGAATDGVSKILLYTTASSAITFSLASKKEGTIAALDGSTNNGVSVTIQPVNGKIVAVYTAPDGYGINSPTDKRNIIVKTQSVANAGDSGSVAVQLVTPPVVLVHGMWGTPKSWDDDGGLTGILSNRGFRVFKADYAEHSAYTFNPNSYYGSNFGRTAVSDAIKDAKNALKADGIIAVQVDVVAHSLGGLMSRSLSQQTSFLRIDNYQKGDIHKLITLCTPHRGSPFGPELWNNRFKTIKLPRNNFITVSEITASQGMPIGSVHADFGIESDGIKALIQTPPFLTYSITANYKGNGSIPQSDGYNSFWALSNLFLSKSYDDIMASRCTSSGVLPHDLIVPVSSQRGYISNTAMYWGTGHSSPASNTVRSNPLVQDTVIKLLFSTDTTAFGRGFPAPSLQPLDCTTAAYSVGASEQTVQVFGENTVLGGATSNLEVHITAPLLGSTYRVDGTDSISFVYQPIGTTKPAQALFMVEGIGWYEAPVKSPYTVKIPLPKNISLGSLNIFLGVKDSTGVTIGDTSRIAIIPSGTLDSLAVAPNTMSLDSSSREKHVYVTGYFKKGTVVSHADITNGSSGTTYRTISGKTTIVKINSNGIVTGVNPGKDTIVVTNGSKTKQVIVSVDSNYSTKYLYPNSINFSVPDKLITDAPFALTATATSGDAVSYSLLSGQVSLLNGIVTINGEGSVKIVASSVGNAYFKTPKNDTVSFNISKPVTLKSFTAILTSTRTVGLNWQTINEINTQSFTIQRSSNGVAFSNLDIVIAKGSNSTYTFTDKQPLTGYNYYRLLIRDNDGSFKFSDTCSIYNSSIFEAKVYPNPTKDKLTLQINSLNDENANIRIVQADGKTIHNFDKNLIRGINILSLSLNNIAAGNYFVVIETASEKQKLSFIKQ